MSNLSKRAYTALFFVASMLVGILGGTYTFLALFALVTALCLWEFYHIVLAHEKRRDKTRHLIAVSLGMTPFVIAALIQLQWLVPSTDFTVAATLVFISLLFLIFLFELFTASDRPFENIALVILGIIYVGLPFALLCFAAFPDGVYHPEIVLSLIVVNWINDTMAYVAGSRFGKTPLFPRISPKKTWEGTIGGLLGSILTGVLFYVFTDVFQLTEWLILVVIIKVFGDLGDLVESMLKRSYDMKDSGTLLPGHGGFLDRFDAFIFLLPFATLYIILGC
jgi:phosphatidate cytidylyltransferase